MLRNVSQLTGFAIRARDGQIGTLEHFYFDDESWAIRYLVVNTGDWLNSRLVLVSPIALRQAEWHSKRLDVALTKSQIENSPPIDTHQPVSRQHETAYLGYYGYPSYWAAPNYPAALEVRRKAIAEAEALQAGASREPSDVHLRSTEAVAGYHIQASDGEIGHVEDFIVDDATWDIRYLEVDTRNLWPGKKVLVSPQWINRVSWADSKVYVDMTTENIRNGPEWVDSIPVTREYEHRLYDYYARPPYWAPVSDPVHKRAPSQE